MEWVGLESEDTELHMGFMVLMIISTLKNINLIMEEYVFLMEKKWFRDKFKFNITLKGEKPFACNVCGKGFTRPNYCQIHQRKHKTI